MFLLLFGVLYLIFADYYVGQREKRASIILEGLKQDISEVSYVLSRNVSSKTDAPSFRAVLERYVSHNDYIASAMVLDDSTILLSTDPHYSSAPSKSMLRSDMCTDSSAYEQLSKKKGIEGNIRFYEGAEQRELKLLFLLDREELLLSISKEKAAFLISFGLLPVLILIVAWFVLQYFVVKPLEKLRQYAYYQSKVPKAFNLKELESIRSSMVQTFSRLENEQKELFDMARTDALSGLANRNALEEYLKRLIANAARTKQEFAFLFLDLDHFKSVNDALGHAVGDELLLKVASVIQEVLRTNDFVARIGGDEFVIVLDNYKSLLELTEVVERIQTRLELTWVVQTHPITISSSIGIALFPKDGDSIVSLMQHADIAMYEAKNKGRAQYHYFTEELNAKVQESIALDKAMREALKAGEYELHYQPKTDVKSGRIVGAEALIRWISPSRGVVSPYVFIPLAEENGFIVELGYWVLQEALEQQMRWKEKGLNISVSVNIATSQLLDPAFESKLLGLLRQTGADPAKLDFEITEYLFFEQNKNNFEVLNTIRSFGISISLDDFGTGYSSLSYLKKFPIDNLKIDKSFVDDYNTFEGAVFLETIVKMGQALKMNIIAEGVEKKEQLAYLHSIGCDSYQGYYRSKPLPAAEFEHFYTEQELL